MPVAARGSGAARIVDRRVGGAVRAEWRAGGEREPEEVCISPAAERSASGGEDHLHSSLYCPF